MKVSVLLFLVACAQLFTSTGSSVINEVHEDGRNLLHLAAKEDDFDIFKVLHVAGADCIARTKDGLSTADIAKAADNTLVIKYIEDVCHITASGKLPHINDEI